MYIVYDFLTPAILKWIEQTPLRRLKSGFIESWPRVWIATDVETFCKEPWYDEGMNYSCKQVGIRAVTGSSIVECLDPRGPKIRNTSDYGWDGDPCAEDYEGSSSCDRYDGYSYNGLVGVTEALGLTQEEVEDWPHADDALFYRLKPSLYKEVTPQEVGDYINENSYLKNEAFMIKRAEAITRGSRLAEWMRTENYLFNPPKYANGTDIDGNIVFTSGYKDDSDFPLTSIQINESKEYARADEWTTITIGYSDRPSATFVDGSDLYGLIGHTNEKMGRIINPTALTIDEIAAVIDGGYLSSVDIFQESIDDMSLLDDSVQTLTEEYLEGIPSSTQFDNQTKPSAWGNGSLSVLKVEGDDKKVAWAAIMQGGMSINSDNSRYGNLYRKCPEYTMEGCKAYYEPINVFETKINIISTSILLDEYADRKRYYDQAGHVYYADRFIRTAVAQFKFKRVYNALNWENDNATTINEVELELLDTRQETFWSKTPVRPTIPAVTYAASEIMSNMYKDGSSLGQLIVDALEEMSPQGSNDFAYSDAIVYGVPNTEPVDISAEIDPDNPFAYLIPTSHPGRSYMSVAGFEAMSVAQVAAYIGSSIDIKVRIPDASFLNKLISFVGVILTLMALAAEAWFLAALIISVTSYAVSLGKNPAAVKFLSFMTTVVSIITIVNGYKAWLAKSAAAASSAGVVAEVNAPIGAGVGAGFKAGVAEYSFSTGLTQAYTSSGDMLIGMYDAVNYILSTLLDMGTDMVINYVDELIADFSSLEVVPMLKATNRTVNLVVETIEMYVKVMDPYKLPPVTNGNTDADSPVSPNDIDDAFSFMGGATDAGMYSLPDMGGMMPDLMVQRMSSCPGLKYYS